MFWNLYFMQGIPLQSSLAVVCPLLRPSYWLRPLWKRPNLTQNYNYEHLYIFTSEPPLLLVYFAKCSPVTFAFHHIYQRNRQLSSPICTNPLNRFASQPCVGTRFGWLHSCTPTGLRSTLGWRGDYPVFGPLPPCIFGDLGFNCKFYNLNSVWGNWHSSSARHLVHLLWDTLKLKR